MDHGTVERCINTGIFSYDLNSEGLVVAFWEYPKYVCKAEKLAKAAKKLEQLKKKRDVKPVILQRGAIARTWWGKSWNRNLEQYADYSNRVGRGKSYVRHGAILDLLIKPGEVSALVQGSRSKPYEVVITIKKLNMDIWRNISAECGGKLDSLQELLTGKFPAALGETFMQQGAGLFPGPKEISFDCSCPDWADMCKHVAASLYGVGARLDEDPSLFFTLRGVEMNELIATSVASKTEKLLQRASQKSSRIMEGVDLASMFGIDLADGPATPVAIPDRKPVAKALKKEPVVMKRKTAGKRAAMQTATKMTASKKIVAVSQKSAIRKRRRKATKRASRR